MLETWNRPHLCSGSSSFPWRPQIRDWSCGPIALQLAATSLGMDLSLDGWITLTRAKTLEGSSETRMVGAARRAGLKVGIKRDLSFDSLTHLVARKDTVSIGYFDSADGGHWVAIPWTSDPGYAVVVDGLDNEPYGLKWGLEICNYLITLRRRN